MPGKHCRASPGPWNEIWKMANTENPVTQEFFQLAIIQLGDGAKVRY